MAKLQAPISKKSRATRLFLALSALYVLIAPFLLSLQAFAQTEPPPPGATWGPDPGANLSGGAAQTRPTARAFPDEPPTNYVNQAAEQNKDIVIQNVENLLTDNFRNYNETYMGLHTFWGDDIISNLFANIGQLIGKWLTEFINGWISDTVQFLTGFLRVFVLNPNIAVNGMNNGAGGGQRDDISPFIRQGADVMYGIAVDLLLLLFILCIWKFWAEASWRGGGHLLGAVGRLIFTAGLMLAWPTIYAFEIQITNEMIQAVYFNSADQVAALDAAMAAAVKGGLMAGAALIANATAPVAGQAFGGILGTGPAGIAVGTVGGLVAFVGLIIYLILGGILIAELVYILVLKAIQTALLTAQYMFAPIFIVFFATPDTENVTAGFVKSFVEVSLWTFVWVGLLKIFVIMILSDFNPWGKIILAVGILQIMIQVPSFLARAQISPLSDFISAGLISGTLMNAGKALSGTLAQRSMQLAKVIGGDTTTGAARGPELSKKADLKGLPHGPRDPRLLSEIRKASRGGGPGDPKKGPEGSAPVGPDGKPIKPPGGGKPGEGGTPPVKKPGEKDPKKPGPGDNPAADASVTGKPLNPTGVDPAAQLGKNALGTAAAVGVGAGMAAMNGQGINKPQTPGGSGDEETRKAAEQAALASKELANLENAGVGHKGEDKDKKGGEKVQVVPGKELNQGGDPTKDAKEQAAKLGAGADLAAALGGKGLKPPGKPGDKTDGPGGTKDLTQQVDKTVKPAGATDPKATGVPPTPTAADLAALNKEDPTKAGGQTGGVGPDGKPLNMDVEEEGKLAGGVGQPGVKLAQGNTTGGGADKDKTGVGTPGNLAAKTPVVGTGAQGPEIVVNRKPGDESKGSNARHSDPAISQIANNTGSPTTGRNIDPTTGMGDVDATDDKGLVPPGTAIPKPVATGKPGDLKVDGDKPGEVKIEPTVQAGGTTAPVSVGVNLPGRRTQAPIGSPKLDPNQVGADGVDQTADPTLNPGMVTGGAGNSQLRPDQAQTTVRPADGKTGTDQPTHRIEIQPTVAPTGTGAGVGTTVNVPHMPKRSPSNRVPGIQNFIDPGWEPEEEEPKPGAPGAPGGPGKPPTGGGGMPPGDGGSGPPRPAHGVAPESPHQQRLDATQQVVPMNNYQQAYYRWIPPRGISGAIRLAQDTTLGPSTSGEPELYGNAKGNTFHVRHAEGMDPDRLALQMMTAGYASIVGSDPVAYDAARASAIEAGADQPKGIAQRMAAGILAYNGGSWAQTANAKQSFQQALYTESVKGSQAYVSGQPGNAYTQYLNERYGPMTDEQQAWGVHIMTDPGSPESSWHWGHIPATETLVRNAVPINAVSRAIATNATVLRSRPWEQRAAIAGSTQYMEARKANEIPDAHPMVADAWVGREAQLLPPAVVNTITALTSEMGDDVCRNVAMVNDVANIVGAGADQKDYVSAFQSLRAVASVGNGYVGKYGGGGPISGGSMPIPGGFSPRGGGGGGGTVVTNVSGSVMPGGGGAAATVDVDVPMDDGGQGPVGPINLGNLQPPAMSGHPGGAGTQANVTFRPGAGAPPPSRSAQTIRMQAPPSSGAANGPITINPTNNVGAPPPIINDQQVEVEIVPGHTPPAPPIDPSLIKVPDNVNPQQEVRANVTFIPGSTGGGGTRGGGTQRIRFETPYRDSTMGYQAQYGSYNDPSQGGQTIEEHVSAEIVNGAKTGDYGSINPNDIDQDVQHMMSQFSTTAEMAYNVVYDLHAAGFSYAQLADTSVAKSAMQVYSQDPSMASTAAVCAKAVGPQNFNVERTHVVQAMMDSDPKWNPNNIDAKSVYTGEAIMRVFNDVRTECLAQDPNHAMGNMQAYPTRDFVEQVQMHPQFNPRPVEHGNYNYDKSVIDMMMDRFTRRAQGKDPSYGGYEPYSPSGRNS